MINTLTKSSLGRKHYVWHTCPYHSLSLSKVRTGTQAEAGTRTMEECCLLSCSSWLAQLVFLHLPGPPAISHNGLSPATSIINYENIENLSTGQFDGGSFSIGVLVSQITCVKLTKTKEYYNKLLKIHECQHSIAQWQFNLNM